MNFETMNLLDRSIELNVELANALTQGHYETLMKFKELQDAVLVHKKEQEAALPKPDIEIKPKPKKKEKEYKPKIKQGDSPLDSPKPKYEKNADPPDNYYDDPLADAPPENDSLPF